MDGLAETARPRVLAVCGPTATGKSALALHLARRFGGQLVGADSMQVYAGLPIGTAAVTPQEAGAIPQHLVGFLPPQQAFSVADWLTLAHEAIADIVRSNALSILCGGTGLYISSLVKGIDYTQQGEASALRQSLAEAWEREGGQALYQQLQKADPERAAQLHPNDQKRVLRALEQFYGTGKQALVRDAESRQGDAPYNFLLLGLNYGTRGELYETINARVLKMMDTGLEAEARRVWQNRNRYKTAAQAIGYKELFPWFEGAATKEEAVARLQQATRNYAKRQLTWFNKLQGVHWLQANSPQLHYQAEALVEAFLKH